MELWNLCRDLPFEKNWKRGRVTGSMHINVQNMTRAFSSESWYELQRAVILPYGIPFFYPFSPEMISVWAVSVSRSDDVGFTMHAS